MANTARVHVILSYQTLTRLVAFINREFGHHKAMSLTVEQAIIYYLDNKE